MVWGEIPRPRKEKKLPIVLSLVEVACIFDAVDNLKHRALLMVTYAGGLRVGEVVRLRIGDIDAERNMTHVRQAKGRIVLGVAWSLNVIRQHADRRMES